MIPSLISVLSALFSAVGKIFEWLYARNLTDAGKVQAELDALRKQVRDAQIAVAAREAIRAASAAAVGKSPDGVVPIDESDPNLRD